MGLVGVYGTTTVGYGDGVTGGGVGDTTVNVGDDFFEVVGAEETVGGTGVGVAVGGTEDGGEVGGDYVFVIGGT